MLIYIVVFVEGFCSLGAEIIALRRLLPHVGSSIVVTAPTIGFFLFALALGYASGGRVSQNFTQVVARNFLLSALFVGLGLSGGFVAAIFQHVRPAPLAYLVFVGGVLCPIAWLLGQTVPILTNLMKHERVGQASGMALYWSTLGSFLGAVGLSVVVMQALGVTAAVLITSACLVVCAVLLKPRQPVQWAMAMAVTGMSVAMNQHTVALVDTAYADYNVTTLNAPGQTPARRFELNGSWASQVDDATPPNFTHYISSLRHTLLNDLAFTNRAVLVLGAGGFALSHKEPLNQYTYVDIDPAIKDIAERHFLKAPANGRFVADDARHFVLSTNEWFDAIVIDTYSSPNSMPAHLVTLEFWQTLRKPLTPDGVVLANLIFDSRLESAYARNVLNTVEQVFGRCSVNVLHKSQAFSNTMVVCFNSSQRGSALVYTDEKSRADMDFATQKRAR